MRILLLTILFTGSYYFFTKEEKSISPTIDTIRLKMGAPDRVDRILTVDKPVLEVNKVSVSLTQDEGSKTEISSSVESDDLEHVEEIQLNDIEEGWNTELKDMLKRLEPADGEEIHKSYLQEQEQYQVELTSLMEEKQQKTSKEASLEVEHLIGILDQKHQDRLKEIFGAHFEAVRDSYDIYMESASSEE